MLSLSQVPQQFQTQYDYYANPPTLLLPIYNILHQISLSFSASNNNSTAAYHHMENGGEQGGESIISNNKRIEKNRVHLSYLKQVILPKVEKWYQWFKNSQAG